MNIETSKLYDLISSENIAGSNFNLQKIKTNTDISNI